MSDKNSVAIIGMGCLFPKSEDLKDYWQLLYHGKDAITDIPESHWSPSEYYNAIPKPRIAYTASGADFYRPFHSILRNSASPLPRWRQRTLPSYWGYWQPKGHSKTADTVMIKNLIGIGLPSFSGLPEPRNWLSL